MIERARILGVVGHGADKFTPQTEVAARQSIRDALVTFRTDVVCSGHSPLGGVDIWAEEEAEAAGLETLIHAPTRFSWGAPGGYRDRNLAIAQDSDLVLVVVVKELPQGYTGMRFKGCCHCHGRVPVHVKSGGCWTAWKCERQAWRIIG